VGKCKVGAKNCKNGGIRRRLNGADGGGGGGGGGRRKGGEEGNKKGRKGGLWEGGRLDRARYERGPLRGKHGRVGASEEDEGQGVGGGNAI